jgi:uncharacterized protein (DUF427 family)
MSLTLGKGPLGGAPGGAFNFSLDDAPPHRIFFEDYPARLRAKVGDTVVVDTVGAKLLHETAIKPVVYVPLADIDASLLTPTDTSTHCPFKGDASYWTVTVGDREIPDALWAYESPKPDAAWLKGYGALYWDKVDEWYVEDERIEGSLRDPYHRVDVHASSRPVVVRAAGQVIAESTRPKILIETSLAPRVYIPCEDVKVDLEPSDRRTHCAYKGHASYWSANVGGRLLQDVAWTYEEPLAESADIAGHLSFDGEAIEVELG